jgi:CspA family cold shock protein
MSGVRVTGRVKFFIESHGGTAKGTGYGFIAPDDGGPEVFVHRSALGRSCAVNGVHTLSAGQHVAYDVEQSERGKKAASVELV